MDFTGEGNSKTQINSAPSKLDAQFLPMEEEMNRLCKDEVERRTKFLEAGLVDDDNPYLSAGKPFFDAVLSKSQVYAPFLLYIPASMIQLFPRETVPVVLRHGGKTWNTSYIGNSSRPRFDPRWRSFVEDNHLKLGDSCVFELKEASEMNLKFKVHILRHEELPPELVELIDSRGKTSETAICVD